MSGRIALRMKTLYVMRHAKSSWDDASMADFDRPLNERGKQAAPFMGGLMRRRQMLPEIIVSSPAKRARSTAKRVCEGGSLAAEVIFDERIYEASPNALREIVADLDEAYSSAMLVGHNPGMEGFIRYLTGHIEPMPTAAIAVVELDIERWADITGECGELKEIFRPKDEMS